MVATTANTAPAACGKRHYGFSSTAHSGDSQPAEGHCLAPREPLVKCVADLLLAHPGKCRHAAARTYEPKRDAGRNRLIGPPSFPKPLVGTGSLFRAEPGVKEGNRRLGGTDHLWIKHEIPTLVLCPTWFVIELPDVA
jgi:hypothetical protein